MNNQTIIGIISGYFDPLHLGHLEYIHAAKNKVDYLIVIVNNDKQTILKKSKAFMDENHRTAIIKELRDVDEVMISIDTDRHICSSLNFLRKKYSENNMYFFNSGDRVGIKNSESIEIELCEKIGIKYVEIPLPKIYSSSKLISNIKQ